MNESQFDQTLKRAAGSAGRRDALRSLGAVGIGLLAALGLTDGAAKDKSGNGDNGQSNNRKSKN